MLKVTLLVGSIRRHSINDILAKALEKLAGRRMTFHRADLVSLPHYNDDLWSDPPESVLAFKTLVEASDAVLIVTPEFNRSIPGMLKNALDWGSRPWGNNSWARKPVAIAGASSGGIGTAVAQSHLRSILPILDCILLGQPEVYVQFRPDLLDEEFNVTDEQTRSFLDAFLSSFEQLVKDQKTGRGS
ncbi:NADPH-dependent FMN reductase [Mesorhizobium amorphae]|uniref:NADPH-dependent FMN reductase n=1 Tax=Mesorhizobium amorphae TaxID=71433 RepID=UPI001184DE3B|nr:NADPH-dependent FMN reductase [Mesorhizobium amorphae]